MSNALTQYLNHDPIFAVITGNQAAPVAIIRISGSHFLESFCSLMGIDSKKMTQRKACYAILNDQGQILDDVLLLWIPGPNSFTGEDVLEIHFHGSAYLQRRMSEILLQKYRQALPGEFSFRAVKNNRMTLQQAEAIDSAIRAKNSRQHRAAKKLWSGTQNQDLLELREMVKATWVYIETNIDFVEDVSTDFNDVISNRLAQITALLEKIAKRVEQNSRLATLPQIALLGLPNVGKSTLFNQLVGENLAIVYDQPGTTRDLLGKRLVFDGEYDVEILDTAGLREAVDPIEKLGVDKVKTTVKQVEVVLLVLDLTENLEKQLTLLWAQTGIAEILDECVQQKRKTIILLNKSDAHKLTNQHLSQIEQFLPNLKVQAVSGLNGTGLNEVRQFVLNCLKDYFEAVEPLQLSQKENAILQEVQALITALKNKPQPYALELLAEDFRALLRALEHVMEPIVNDEILASIFSQFCIGK